MSIKRKLSLSVAAFGLVAASLFSAIPANAASYPSNCNTWKEGMSAYAVCYSGGGAYRASVACEGWNWLGQRVTSSHLGPLKPIGQISKVTCDLKQIYSYGYRSYQ